MILHVEKHWHLQQYLQLLGRMNSTRCVDTIPDEITTLDDHEMIHGAVNSTFHIRFSWNCIHFARMASH